MGGEESCSSGSLRTISGAILIGLLFLVSPSHYTPNKQKKDLVRIGETSNFSQSLGCTRKLPDPFYEKVTDCQLHEGNMTVFSALTQILAHQWVARANGETTVSDQLSFPCLPLQIHSGLMPEGYANYTLMVREACATSRLLTYLDLGFPIEGIDRRTDILHSPMLRSIYSTFSLSAPSVSSNASSSKDIDKENWSFVVYMDTTSIKSTPLSYYVERIPTYAKSIQVIISCTQSCLSLTNLTVDYFKKMFPRSAVTAEATTSEWKVASKVINAPTLVICNDASLCILRIIRGGKTVMVENDQRFPWLLDLINSNESSIVARNKVESTPTRNILPPESCRNLVGRRGRWVQDWDYARQAQYKIPLSKWSKFSNQTGIRDATTFKWADQECPVQLLTLQNFCATLETFAIKRVMIVGDSLNGHMALSLWKLLGHDDDPQHHSQPGKHWFRNVTCGGSNLFELSMYRNDHLDDSNVTSPGMRDKCTGGRSDFCLAWLNDYISSADPTLLIANFGAHVYSTHQFREEMDGFLALLNRFQRPRDVVIYRTTVPGHVHCQRATQPLATYGDFAPMLHNAPHSWDIFDDYNDYAKFAIAARNQRQAGLQVHVLDVVPMTVLRPDGHVSGPQKCDDCPSNDCLHYMLPGPNDWWNHLLYTSLATLAQQNR